MSAFAVVDVETANADLSSICQVGVVHYLSGNAEEMWSTLLEPEDFFDSFNVRIHGIDERATAGAPTFPAVYEQIRRRLEDRVVVSHTYFDRVALQRACAKYDLRLISCQWLDSARVARRVWPELFAQSGYSLVNVAAELGIEYKAHDALQDAWAAGQVLVAAIRHSGLQLEDWLVRAGQPIFQAGAGNAYRANVDGPLFGEAMCFTGALSIPRREAAEIAAQAGCVVCNAVTSRTTLLVVGEQDARRLSGHKISSKHRKAEQLIASGHQIRILSESDFRRIVHAGNPTAVNADLPK